MITPRQQSRISWVHAFMVLLLIALVVQPSPAYAQDPEPYEEFAKAQFTREIVGGAPQKDITASAVTGRPRFTREITSSSSQEDVTSSAVPVGTNLILDPSFEASFFDATYWFQYSDNRNSPLCTPAECGFGAGTAGPRAGSTWVWFGGIWFDNPNPPKPIINPESAFVSQFVAFPAAKSCKTTLQFYLWIGFAEAGADVNDDFVAWVDFDQVFVANATQQAAYSTYTLVSIDVSAYNNGQVHEIFFDSLTSDQIVNFSLDDVSLVVSDCAVVKGDYNGDFMKDIAVFRPSNNTWYIRGLGSFVYGGAGDIPVPADYTGDGITDIAVFRPSNNTWYIRGLGPAVYGGAGDIPVVGDYNGDGKADIAVFRPSNNTWYLRGMGPVVFGGAGDIPVVGDYNGDGRADIAVFRPSNNTWYIRGMGSVVFGGAGDTPVVGDYNGDGKADIAVFRPSNNTWYLRGMGSVVFGGAGDIPVVGDYDGDRKADIAVFRPSNNTWYIRGMGSVVFGGAGDIPQ